MADSSLKKIDRIRAGVRLDCSWRSQAEMDRTKPRPKRAKSRRNWAKLRPNWAKLGQTEAEKGQTEAEVGQTEAVVGLKVSNSIVKNRGGDMFSILS